MKKTDIDTVRFLDIVKPDVSIETARHILKDLYGLSGKLRPLDSERDVNFHVVAVDGGQFLLKISNQEESLDTINFEIAALAHIAKTRPTLPVPRLLNTSDGCTIGSVPVASGVELKVRLLTFLPGTVLADVARTDTLVFNQGKMAAEMALALQGFFHPAAGSRQLLWDIREVGALRPIAEKLANPDTRALILGIIENFQRDIKPDLDGLRGQIAHMDLTRYNMVVANPASEIVSGILDFGDMHHGPLIQDVAIAVADIMQPEPNPYSKAQHFLRGYHHVLPLQRKEIAMLYDLVLAYLATYYLILIRRGATYDEAAQVDVLALIEDFTYRGQNTVTDLFSEACGRPRPEGVATGNVDALVARRKTVMGEPLYVFYDPPLNIIRGDGAWLYDTADRAYLDVYNNVPLVGHAHPYVAQAVARQIGQLNTNTRYICDEIIAYAERLTSTMPQGLFNAFFVNSGSEANELAWLMAEAYTGNSGAIIIEDAYHGWTKAVAALSPSGKPDAPIASHVRIIPAPDLYRAPFKNRADLLEHYSQQVDTAIDSLAQAGLKPALCIVDSAFCTNGILEPLPGYLAMVFDKVRRAGGLCVADEVQSGFGRMGQDMWGFNLHQVVPDIVTLGKPMANGYPMGAVITRPDVLEAVSKGGAIFSTFGGNNVAAVAASAVLDIYNHDELRHNSAATGLYLKSNLQRLAVKHDIIGDIRGSGLILGAELVLDKNSKVPAARETNRLLQIMSELGVLMGSDGPYGNVIKLRPPLVFNKEHADVLLDRLDEGLTRL